MERTEFIRFIDKKQWFSLMKMEKKIKIYIDGVKENIYSEVS